VERQGLKAEARALEVVPRNAQGRALGWEEDDGPEGVTGVRQPKQHTAEFKAQVAVEPIWGYQTLNNVASIHGVPPV